MEYSNEMTQWNSTILIDQCLAKPSSKVLFPAVDENKHLDPQVEIVKRESETLKCTVLNVMFLSNPFSWGSGNSVEEEAERLWEPVERIHQMKQCLLDTNLCTYELPVAVATCREPAQS